MHFFQLFTNLTVLNNSSELVHDSLVDISLLADHRVVLVVTVVGIPRNKCVVTYPPHSLFTLPELAVWPELKL